MRHDQLFASISYFPSSTSGGTPAAAHRARRDSHILHIRGWYARLLAMLRQNRYTLQVPNRWSVMSPISEHVFVCKRYVSMESLAIFAPVARSDDVDPGLAPARTPGSVIIRGDLELERVIGCAEANVSTQADQAHPQVWLPGPHGRSRRSGRAGPATAQRPPCAHRRGREQVHAEPLGASPWCGDRSGTPAGGR